MAVACKRYPSAVVSFRSLPRYRLLATISSPPKSRGIFINAVEGMLQSLLLHTLATPPCHANVQNGCRMDAQRKSAAKHSSSQRTGHSALFPCAVSPRWPVAWPPKRQATVSSRGAGDRPWPRRSIQRPQSSARCMHLGMQVSSRNLESACGCLDAGRAGWPLRSSICDVERHAAGSEQ